MSVVTIIMCFVTKILVHGLFFWSINGRIYYACLIVSLLSSLDSPCTLICSSPYTKPSATRWQKSLASTSHAMSDQNRKLIPHKANTLPSIDHLGRSRALTALVIPVSLCTCTYSHLHKKILVHDYNDAKCNELGRFYIPIMLMYEGWGKEVMNCNQFFNTKTRRTLSTVYLHCKMPKKGTAWHNDSNLNACHHAGDKHYPLRDPVSASVAVSLIVLEIIYSLYNVSILIDLPLLGNCSNPSEIILYIMVFFSLYNVSVMRSISVLITKPNLVRR